MRKLKAAVASLDDVEERLREHYKPTDDGFALDLDDVTALPELGNLVRAQERVVADGEKLAAELAELQAKFDGLPDGLTADEIERLRALAKRAVDNGGDVGAVARLERELTDRQAAHDAAIAKKETWIRNKRIDAALRDQLEICSVKPAFVKAAIALLTESGNFEIDGERVFVETRFGKKSIKRFVRDWCRAGDGVKFVDWKAAGERGPAFFGMSVKGAAASSGFADAIRAMQNRR